MSEKFIDGQVKLVMMLTKERSVEVNFNVASTDDAKKIDQKLDMYQDAITRQFIRLDLASKEAQLAAEKAQAESIMDQHAEMKKREHLSSVQKQTFENYEQSLSVSRARIKSLEMMIKAGKTKLNGAARA